LTKLKKTKRYFFFKKLDAQVIQEILERLEKGYQAFFDKRSNIPKFKSHKFYNSITFKQTGYKLLENNKVKIKGKVYKYFKSRPLGGEIKRVSIKRDSLGDFYICFSCLVMDRSKSESAKLKTANRCGFDFGLKTFLTCSDGNRIESPLYLKQNIKKLKKKAKRLSRKQKGSNNRQRAKLDLARLHKKISNQRRDFLMKLSLNLVKEYDELYFEDLNIKGMQKLWGRKVSDLGFSNFLNLLEYRCLEYGKQLIKVDRWFPSSKKCSGCGYINKDLALSDRSWICPGCGANHERDLNASINIYEAGSSASGVGQVRPENSIEFSGVD
jgi:putative transposase